VGKPKDIFKDPLKAVRKTGEKAKQIVTDPLKAGRELVEQTGEAIGDTAELAKQTITDPLQTVRQVGEDVSEIIQAPITGVKEVVADAKTLVTDPLKLAREKAEDLGVSELEKVTGGILEQARKDVEKFGETTGISDTLLQARDVGAELINVLDIADGFESPSEKKAKEEARKDAQALADAETEAQRQKDLESRIGADRAKLEQEKLGGVDDPTGVGLGNVRVMGLGTAPEEEDEILRSLKKFGGR